MRHVIAIAALVLVVAGLAGVKYSQISSLLAMGRAMAQSGPPPEAVASARAEVQPWPGRLVAVGSVSSARGVTVSNEVPGVVTAIRFESGALVKRGEVLVELDTGVERAQLASARARKDLASTNAGRSRSLFKDGAIPPVQLDSDESTLKSSRADEGALRAQIERKTVRAPFAGRLGIRQINLGQYLSPGTPITELEAVDVLYVDFTLPQQRLAEVAVGLPVRVTIDGAAAPVAGTIGAIDPAIDAATRSIRMRATVAGGDPRLRPGMFANVEVELPGAAQKVVIPATAVVHAAYGDSVFVVEDRPPAPPRGGPAPPRGGPAPAPGTSAKIARQQFVRLGEARGDFVAVADGVAAGQEVVTDGAFKLRNGGGVVVREAVTPAPQLAPHPENR